MSDSTKIRGFRNVSTPHQAVFITEGGEARISQLGPRRWKVLPRGGEAYEVSGKQRAIDEARSLATGLTLQGSSAGCNQASLPRRPQPLKKSHAQIKREVDEVLARPAGRGSSDRATELIANYKPWEAKYSYEEEDRTSSLAGQLTDIDRQEGRAAPPVGYSTGRFQQARQVVKDANLYGEHQQRLTRGGSSHAAIRGRGAPLRQGVDFFRKHAGYAVRAGESKARARTRGAQVLARAEAEASARGWRVDWEEDPEEWQGDSARPFEVLSAVLRDAAGRVLASLGSIGMTGNRRTDADYSRVVEAELAAEALGGG